VDSFVCSDTVVSSIFYSFHFADAGRLAAVWAQYETQETLSKVAKDYNVNMTFFHGKGGTIGRGGNPQTFLAIMAHTPNTINGHFRVTEQVKLLQLAFVKLAVIGRMYCCWQGKAFSSRLLVVGAPSCTTTLICSERTDKIVVHPL